jgi:hypothetical protein
VSVGVAVAGIGLAIGVAQATADDSPNPACPAVNAPNTLILAGGSPQTAALDTAFGGNLQVTLANTNGCPLTTTLAGVAVTFSAPASGASGAFAASGSNTLTAGTDASGMAAAAMFSANGIAGSYTILARSPYGSVSFAMTNSAAGIPAAITVVGRASQSATVSTRYKHPLEVKLRDASGTPLQGVSVTFSLGSGSSGSATAAGAGASFSDGTTQATATTDAAGHAVSPRFTAGTTAGSFVATAAVAGSARRINFRLRNVAGPPAAVTPGSGSSQATSLGGRFPVRLAVTVTDAHGNVVPGAIVTFAAPVEGPRGRFVIAARDLRARTVRATTGATGVAVAPPFTATATTGGYVVRASVAHVAPAAFALVNERPGS